MNEEADALIKSQKPQRLLKLFVKTHRKRKNISDTAGRARDKYSVGIGCRVCFPFDDSGWNEAGFPLSVQEASDHSMKKRIHSSAIHIEGGNRSKMDTLRRMHIHLHNVLHNGR